MATSLSIDSSPATFREHNNNSITGGLGQHEPAQPPLSKKTQSGIKTDSQQSTGSGQGASQQYQNNSASNAESSARGSNLNSSSQYQQQSLLANSGLTYPILPSPYYGTQFLQSITTPTAQSQSSYYSTSTHSSSNVNTQQSQSNTGNNRRGGKKKAPLTQQQTSQSRTFFNLKKKEVTTQQPRGPSHMYKPKNPLSISEWFKRLSVEERINGLTTIYPQLVETLINMNKRIEQSGRPHCFAVKETNYYDHKPLTPMFYSSSYASALYSSTQSSTSQTSFEENFYCREQNDTELRTIMITEKEKFEAEQEIMQHVRLTDFNQYLDTLTVAPDLVSNPDHFFSLMSNATNNQAFKTPCQFQFDSKSQVNTIEAPQWFKPKSFHSFATWILVALEETLWAHYNQDTNQNMSQAKLNDIHTIFKDRSESPDLDVASELLAQFWKDLAPKTKKDLLDQLSEKAAKMPRETLFKINNKNASIRSVQGRDYSYQLEISEIKRDQDLPLEDDDSDINDIMALTQQAKEVDMINNLITTPLKRVEKRKDKLCRELFKTIKSKYQEELVEILLKEEQQQSRPKWGDGGKRKKKRNTQQNQNDETPSGNVAMQEQQQQQEEDVQQQQQQKPSKKKKNKKNTGAQHAYSTSEEHKTEKLNEQYQSQQSYPKTNNKKKKRTTKQNAESQVNKSQQQEAHSCDEQCSDTIQNHDLDIDDKCKSISKASSQYYDQTTAHQSITTLSNSSLTIKPGQSHKTITPPSQKDSTLLTLTQSRSVDCHSHNDQLATIDTQSEECLIKIKPKSSFSRAPTQDEVTINKYVKELTNQMIDEVCLKFESDSSNSKKEATVPKDRNNLEELKLKQKKFNATFYSIGANGQDDDNMKPNTRKPSFKKKQRKESNAAQQESSVGESSLRKSSFSMKIKEDKKFVEDYQQNNSAKLIIQQSSSQMSNESLPVVEVPSETTDTGKPNKKPRKGGFGKANDKPKGQQVQQPAKTNQNNAKPAQAPKKGKQQLNLSVVEVKQDNTDTISQVSVSDTQSTITAGEGQKKKRNRKKGKKDDADIMNNFMKNLQIQSEEVSNYESECKSTKTYNSSSNTYFKKPQYQQKQEYQSKESYYKQKPTTTLNKSNSESFKLSDTHSYKGKQSTQKTEPFKKISSQDQQPFNSARSYQKPQKAPPSKGTYQKVDKRDDDTVSINSNQAETTSDNGQSYYQQKQQQPRFKPKQQQSYNQPFKYSQPKGGEWETTSMTATSNTAEESSCDIQEKRKLSGNDNTILIQDQDLLEARLDKKILPQHQTDDLLHTKSQVYHLHEDTLVPPQIQSPQSCQSSSQLSTQAQCFTPKGYPPQNNYYGNNLRRQTQTNIPGEYNNNSKNGYQSFQNTPNKKQQLQTKQVFKPSVMSSSHSHQNQPMEPSYKTPPQKASPTYSQGNNTNPFKRPHNEAKPVHPKGSHQYKQVQRPAMQMQPQQQHYMNQQQYYVDQHQHHSQTNMPLYYPEPFMPPTRVHQQAYYPPPHQDGVFHYQEQMMAHQQHLQLQYNPTLVNYHSQQYEYQDTNNTMTSPLSQSLTNEQLGFIDQGPDLIYQIFNQINQVHQPMSPLPLNFASPPPMMDYNLENELQQLASNINSQEYLKNENRFYQKLDEDIYAYCAEIQKNIDSLSTERQYVFDKIQKICQEVFTGQSPKLVLFGSLSTGLALESSDMDMAVTGLSIEDRYVMIQQLQKLASALEGWESIVSFKSIDTASIPVIKMKLDIAKMRELELGIASATQLVEDQKILSLDITFDDSASDGALVTNDYGIQSKTHLGLQSCQLVQNYVANYPHLKEVAILLKKFLAIHEFNSPYYGGLSSYSTVLLIVAYMNYYGLRHKTGMSPSRLLMGFLDYYGNYYNPSNFGVSTYNDGSFYQLMGLLESNFVILDPLNLQNNTTRNSYQTKEILQKFQCAFNNLKSLMLPQFQNKSILKGVFSSNSKDSNMSPQNTEVGVSAGIHVQTNNNLSTLENQVSTQPQSNEREEKEASSLLNGQQEIGYEEEQPFGKMNLLEILFAKDAQQIAILRGELGSQSEPKCTHVTQISLTEALSGTVV